MAIHVKCISICLVGLVGLIALGCHPDGSVHLLTLQKPQEVPKVRAVVMPDTNGIPLGASVGILMSNEDEVVDEFMERNLFAEVEFSVWYDDIASVVEHIGLVVDENPYKADYIVRVKYLDGPWEQDDYEVVSSKDIRAHDLRVDEDTPLPAMSLHNTSIRLELRIEDVRAGIDIISSDVYAMASALGDVQARLTVRRSGDALLIKSTAFQIAWSDLVSDIPELDAAFDDQGFDASSLALQRAMLRRAVLAIFELLLQESS